MKQDGVPKLSEERISTAFAAQRGTTPVRVKRFFETAQVAEQDGGFTILLDNRPAKTPARRVLALPTRAAAEAVAAEWNAAGEFIDPLEMPLTRIANVAIDGVTEQMDAVLAEVVGYVGSDLLIYRAGEPEQLVAEQAHLWDPVLDWVREETGARFILAEGVMHVAQPDRTLAQVKAALVAVVGEGAGAPFRATALNVMTSLTGSALLGLAVLRRHLTAGEAWSAAHVDEEFQEARWGQDAEAMERRARRWREMQAAAELARLA